MAEPYYRDDHVALYLGDMREVLPALYVRADACITDPPYGETTLPWDCWPDGWVKALDGVTNSLWCFGSMRMFLNRASEFAGWQMSQDIVWRKHQGTGFTADRFRRIHEHATHWYRGKWRDIHHEAVRAAYTGPPVHHGHHGDKQASHMGAIVNRPWVDDGTRLVTSVIDAKNMHRRGAIHPTEKPREILDPLIRYSVPVGGLVLDPFAGSGSTLLTARSLGRCAVGIEADERYCEAAARRLAEPDLFGGAA